MTIAAAELGMVGSAEAQSGNTKSANVPMPTTHTSFGPGIRTDAGSDRVGVAIKMFY
jgi:hypothetical protein